MPTESDWHKMFQVAAQSMQTVVQPAAHQEITSSGKVDAVPVQAGQPVVEEGPRMKEEWEQQFDAFIAASGGEFDIPLVSGQIIRVRLVPKPGQDPVEVSLAEFRNLSRLAAKLDAKVVSILKKEESEKRIKDLIDRGEGYWANSCCFVEVDKSMPIQGGMKSDTIVAAPRPPEDFPQVDPEKWLAISAGTIQSQVPMRSGTKVIGTLLKTTQGPIYARSAGPNDHKLYLSADWSHGGGFTIDKEMFYAYLTDPVTVIKVVRDREIFFTTSAHIQKSAGIITKWGRENIVMPLRGNYWLVTNQNGEIME